MCFCLLLGFRLMEILFKMCFKIFIYNLMIVSLSNFGRFWVIGVGFSYLVFSFGMIWGRGIIGLVCEI